MAKHKYIQDFTSVSDTFDELVFFLFGWVLNVPTAMVMSHKHTFFLGKLD